MTSDNLNTTEYNPYFKLYIDKVIDNDLTEGLINNFETVVSFYSSIPSEKLNYVYAEGKWTIKDILLHVIDSERVFAYRALRISRGDFTALPGYDHNMYVTSAEADSRSIISLLEEFKSVRQATISLFKSLSPLALKQIGEASGHSISVRALGYIIVGHENHHMQVIKDRYL